MEAQPEAEYERGNISVALVAPAEEFLPGSMGTSLFAVYSARQREREIRHQGAQQRINAFAPSRWANRCKPECC
jgi:hypothetical protein